MTIDADPPPRRGSGRLKAILTLAVIAGLAGALFAINSAADNRAVQLGRDVTQLRQQVSSDEANLRAENSEISSLIGQQSKLSGQMASLNVPTDPLANYDQECAFLPGQTDLYPSDDASNALLWVPCTDSDQITPEPGG